VVRLKAQLVKWKCKVMKVVMFNYKLAHYFTFFKEYAMVVGIYGMEAKYEYEGR